MFRHPPTHSSHGGPATTDREQLSPKPAQPLRLALTAFLRTCHDRYQHGMAAKVPAEGPQRRNLIPKSANRSRSCLALTLLVRRQDNTPNSLLRQTPNPSPFLPPNVHNRSPVETFGPLLCSAVLYFLQLQKPNNSISILLCVKSEARCSGSIKAETFPVYSAP